MDIETIYINRSNGKFFESEFRYMGKKAMSQTTEPMPEDWLRRQAEDSFRNEV